MCRPQLGDYGTTGSSGCAGAQNFWVNHGRHFNQWYVVVPMKHQWYGFVPSSSENVQENKAYT
jgi:hypothetical protein